MIDQITKEKNKQEFIELLRSTKREGIENLISWLSNKSDFFEAPSSTIYHCDICNHCNYLGTRLKRGLFKTNNGLLINADINGSLNILRKEVSNAFTDERYEI